MSEKRLSYWSNFRWGLSSFSVVIWVCLIFSFFAQNPYRAIRSQDHNFLSTIYPGNGFQFDDPVKMVKNDKDYEKYLADRRVDILIAGVPFVIAVALSLYLLCLKTYRFEGVIGVVGITLVVLLEYGMNHIQLVLPD